MSLIAYATRNSVNLKKITILLKCAQDLTVELISEFIANIANKRHRKSKH